VTLAPPNRRPPASLLAALALAPVFLSLAVQASCIVGARDGVLSGEPRWLEPVPARAAAMAQPAVFRWTPVAGADGYRLRVGTAPGTDDLLNIQGISGSATSYPASGELPALKALYARVSAHVAGEWRHAEVRFTADRIAAEWVYPAVASPDVEPGRTFEWTPVPNASAYRVTIGTAPGLADVLDRTLSGSTRLDVAGLPHGRRLVARISTQVRGGWYSRDSDFAVQLGYGAAQPIHPRPGGTADARRPFAWQAVPLAVGYRLCISSSRGGSTLFDSGAVSVTRMFVPALPAGRLLSARLSTVYADRTRERSFDFRAGPGAPDERRRVEAAFAATVDVRAMAGPRGAWPRTPLAEVVGQQRVAGPGCVELALTLLRTLAQQRTGLAARLFNTCLLGNYYDCHTLVELELPSRGRWMLLDPTFAVTARRRGGDWATAREISSAVRREDWTSIRFVPLAEASLAWLHAYYIDYPLLFVSPFGQERPHPNGGPSILRYYVRVPVPVKQQGAYAIRCRNAREAEVVLDGRPTVVTCQGRDALSEIRSASSIEVPGRGADLYRLRRSVF
jgi:hypothetical protein